MMEKMKLSAAVTMEPSKSINTIHCLWNSLKIHVSFSWPELVSVALCCHFGISTLRLNVLCVTDNSSLFAYTLDDGTVGVYNENVRLWRVKVSSYSIDMRSVHIADCHLYHNSSQRRKERRCLHSTYWELVHFS